MDQERSADPTPRGRRVIAFVITAVVLVIAAFVVGRLSAPTISTPTDASAEAGFARDMQVHHAQAVQMSFIIRDETTDPAVRLIALDIATGQAQGAGQLYGYLDDWGLSQSSDEPAMTWMTLPPLSGAGGAHKHAETLGKPLATMPGYASDAQITKLESLKGVAAERLYLQLMIAHHRGGIEMAQFAIARGTYPQLLQFARTVVTVQTAEIANMQQLLAALPAT